VTGEPLAADERMFASLPSLVSLAAKSYDFRVRRSLRLTLLLVVVCGALFASPALAQPPTLLTVGHVDRHPTATWTLPAGVVARVVEVATSPSIASDGYFFFENVKAFSTLEDSQTSWTYGFQIDPGTYYVHVAAWDKSCLSCPIREFSQIMTLVIPASPAPPTPPPPVSTRLLSVLKTGAGVGTVTSDPPGINCGTDCSETYLTGIHVALTATPAAGSVFGGWNNPCGASPRCEITLNASSVETARFDVAPAPATPPPVVVSDPVPVAKPAAVDTVAPKVKALPAAGVAGALVRLRFTVSDASRRTRQQVAIYVGTRLVARRSRAMGPSVPGQIAFVSFRIPKTATRDMKFCVVAWDRAGNASRKSCSQLAVL
jgi:hypothetical protein